LEKEIKICRENAVQKNTKNKFLMVFIMNLNNIEIPDYDGKALDVVRDKDSENYRTAVMFTMTIFLPN